MDVIDIIRSKIANLKQILKEDLERDNGLYWKLSRQDNRIQDQSHWCGVRRWSRDRWFEHGQFHFDLISRYLNKFANPDYIENLHRKTALDWGCGGGANVRLLCENFSHVYGIDVSEATLDECERQMKDFGFGNFSQIFFQSQDPESILDKIEGETIDFILSVAVFQHFPSKSYSQKVLNIMEKLLKKNAYALIQVRYFDGSEKLKQKNENYSSNVIYMTSFTTDEFYRQLKNAGLTLLASEKDIDNADDCHEYFFIQK